MILVYIIIYIQQDEVLAELREYVHNNPKASDAPAVTHTIAYLEALNKIFEKSMLGVKVQVFEPNGSTLQRIDEGYQFFVRWAEEIKSREEDEEKPPFLAWQVRVQYYLLYHKLLFKLCCITDMGFATDHGIWL